MTLKRRDHPFPRVHSTCTTELALASARRCCTPREVSLLGSLQPINHARYTPSQVDVLAREYHVNSLIQSYHIILRPQPLPQDDWDGGGGGTQAL